MRMTIKYTVIEALKMQSTAGRYFQFEDERRKRGRGIIFIILHRFLCSDFFVRFLAF